MKLIKVNIRKFRNIIDSTDVQIQDDVTCLVGKNESGKTAFLQALYRLRPDRKHVTFSVHDEYPAWLEKVDRLRGQDINAFRPVLAVFEFEANDVQDFEEIFGTKVLKSNVSIRPTPSSVLDIFCLPFSQTVR